MKRYILPLVLALAVIASAFALTKSADAQTIDIDYSVAWRAGDSSTYLVASTDVAPIKTGKDASAYFNVVVATPMNELGQIWGGVGIRTVWHNPLGTDIGDLSLYTGFVNMIGGQSNFNWRAYAGLGVRL